MSIWNWLVHPIASLRTRQSEKVAAEQLTRLESLKREFPKEAKQYKWYCIDWAIEGMVFHRLPTFEEWLVKKPLELTPLTKSMLEYYELAT